MGIQNWSDNIVLVSLAAEPEMGEDLQTVLGMVQSNPSLDVVVDFSDVEIVTSSSIAKLLRLRKAQTDNERRLVFCGVKPQTRNIFAVTGLEGVFEFVEDQFLALAGLQMAFE